MGKGKKIVSGEVIGISTMMTIEMKTADHVVWANAIGIQARAKIMKANRGIVTMIGIMMKTEILTAPIVRKVTMMI